jgi:hypothetical protein
MLGIGEGGITGGGGVIRTHASWPRYRASDRIDGVDLQIVGNSPGTVWLSFAKTGSGFILAESSC